VGNAKGRVWSSIPSVITRQGDLQRLVSRLFLGRAVRFLMSTNNAGRDSGAGEELA